MLSSAFMLGSLVRAAELNIIGLPPESKEELIASLFPRLDFITRREPSSWRADDSAFLLKRLLIKAGHADAEVEWTLPGSNTIRLNVTAGPLYMYEKVTSLEPSIISQEDLHQYFLQPLVETELVRINQAPYITEYSEKGATNVANYLKSLGYWNTQVSIDSENINTDTKKVSIFLSVREGNKLTLSKPTFSGAESSQIAEFYPDIQSYLNEPATTENINTIRNIVSGYYSENGYQYAQVEMIPEHGNTNTKLVFDIKPGKKYKVRDIIVEGDDKTKSRRVRRYFDKLKGENYDQTAATKAVNKLISTGAFSNVIITPIPQDQLATAELDLKIEVEETDARSISNYMGIDSYEGAVIGASYTDYNYHGSLRRLDIRGEYSNRGILGQIGVTEPMFAAAPIVLNVRAFLVQRDYEGYDTNQAGAQLSLSWSPNDQYITQFFSGVSFTETNSSSLSPLELGDPDYLHVKTGLSQEIDLRNSQIVPNQGFHGKVLFQAGQVTGDKDSSYLMANLQASYRYQFSEKDAFVSRFSTGVMQSKSDEILPIDVRLFSGGINSQRAYAERELGPRSGSNNPLGGDAYWAATLEYIRTIRDPIKLSLFYDVGQVYADYTDYSFSNASHALGLGVRIDLPIGPIRLEYGRNMNRKSREPSGAFHFSIGASF